MNFPDRDQEQIPPMEVYDLTKAGIIERGLGRQYPLEDSVRRL
jgi:hypothetical protein